MSFAEHQSPPMVARSTQEADQLKMEHRFAQASEACYGFDGTHLVFNDLRRELQRFRCIVARPEQQHVPQLPLREPRSLPGTQ